MLFGGAMAVWNYLEGKYLPPFTLPNTDIKYPRMLSESGRKEIWGLFNDDRVLYTDKVVLGSTFDNVIVMRDNIPHLLDCFDCFVSHDTETNLNEQTRLIEDAYHNDEDLIAIAWNQNSVNCDAWISDVCATNEDGEEEHLPYNLNRDKGHWSLFSEGRLVSS